jgi:hypothetical protein
VDNLKGDSVWLDNMLVTSYYDIYHKPEKFMEYLYLFYDLGASGIPMILFTDPSLVHKFRIFPPCVKVIGVPLETFELYRIGMAYEGELPSRRSISKDTKEFLSLMNTKVEFLLRASEVCEDDTFVWIDFGILKIVNDQAAFLKRLHVVNQSTFDKIYIPGCWSYGSAFTVDAVHWRFCGGIIVFPRKHIEPFFSHSKHVLQDFCTLPQYKLSWETNVWYVVEFCAAKHMIQWYLADHNDSILMNIPLPLVRE